MEKRFVLFLGLSLGIMVGYSMLARTLFPPPPPQLQEEADDAVVDASVEPATDRDDPEVSESPPVANTPARESEQEAAQPLDAVANEPQQRWETFGSYAADSGHSLLVTLNSRGAAIERVELTARDENGRLKYRNLEDKSGYLGNLALTPRRRAGCTVNVVGDGTPAAMAGVQRGDVLLAVDGAPVNQALDLRRILSTKKPGESVNLRFERPGAAPDSEWTTTITLAVRPLELIRPEPLHDDELVPHPLSYLLQLSGRDDDAPRSKNWRVEKAGEGEIEFRLNVGREDDESSLLELVKRFRLGTSSDLSSEGLTNPYHVDMELEIINKSATPRPLSYTLAGPTGLPLEGWWYSAKIHPKMFYGAGARDVLIRTDDERRLVGCPEIYKAAKKAKPSERAIPLFAEDEPISRRTLHYLAVDTQYFVAALLPLESAEVETMPFRRAEAFAVGDVTNQPKGYSRTTDVSFDLTSQPISLEPDAAFKQSFRIVLGPKAPEILEAYDLGDLIYYGWFGGISKVLMRILHFFYGVVGNFGIAIILLTVLVRGCMFPISRKTAKNAAMMQELAPEMRKLTEKYKNDMEKRAKAQQELFRRHNYNPFGGCWLMFLQLPIFLGLYRCIAVDIRLRQAELIPGIDWCSNLAGPDQLVYWKGFMPSLLASESAMLGPYLNVLPLVTVALFLVHQQLFTPPATDEQSRMQLKMMKYMTLFMGFLFFKVASGLCLYFIASSLWGIAERKLVPKPKVTLTGGTSGGAASGGSGKGGGSGSSGGKPGPSPKKPPPPSSNGAEAKKAARKKRNKRR